MENHHFSWENSLFLWWFSIVMLNYQRVTWANHGPILLPEGRRDSSPLPIFAKIARRSLLAARILRVQNFVAWFLCCGRRTLWGILAEERLGLDAPIGRNLIFRRADSRRPGPLDSGLETMPHRRRGRPALMVWTTKGFRSHWDHIFRCSENSQERTGRMWKVGPSAIRFEGNQKWNIQDGAPLSYKLVFKPHEYYSYIYHKP